MKNNNPVIETLTSIWQNFVEETDINPDSTLFDMGLDSIKVIEISEEIFKALNVRLEWDEFNVASSFNDVSELLTAKLAA